VILRYVTSLLLAGTVVAIACVDMSAPSGPASISEVLLPSPTVIVNDTMRNLFTGKVDSIRVTAFDIHNVPIPAVTQFFIPDSQPLAHLDSANLLIAGSRVGTLNLLGQVNRSSLQTPQVRIPVTFKPTTVTASPVKPDTVPFSGDSTKRGTTAITVTVTGGVDSASQGILVRYLVDSAPPSADPKFPAVYFVDDQTGKPSAVDTTNPSGVATRALSVSAVQFAQGALVPGRTDTVVVSVLVSYAGALVGGAPIKFYVPISLENLAAPALVPLRRPTTGDILDPLGSQRGNRWARAVVPGIQRPAR
jgi:hypothetical protein